MFADITEEGLEKDGVLVEIDDAEWTEREDMRAVAEGGDDSPLNSNVQVDKDVMFVRYVPRMKQPEEERPLDIDLTNPPSVLELTRAGLNPGGWTQEYYKPKKYDSGPNKGKYSHHQLPTGLRLAPRNPNRSFQVTQNVGKGAEGRTLQSR